LLARDPALITAASSAISALGGAPPLVLRTPGELLDAVLRGTGDLAHILLEPGPPRHDPSLIEALAEAAPDAALAVLPPRGTAEAVVEARVRTLLTRHPQADAPPTEALEPGLESGRLVLRYQPIVALRDRRLVMVEALARWRSDPLALGADHFVPEMERAGLGRLLAAAVTRIAARDLLAYAPNARIAVSVNLPVEAFERGDPTGWIAAQLRGARLPRRRLAIELTETSPVRDLARLRRSLHRLRTAGHEVLIDDFQLDDHRRRLLTLPFTGVKLDRALVERLPHDPHARHQVRALARSGLTLTAEGVASHALWRGLRNLGIARAQGFWLSRPLPAALLAAWARRWQGVQPR
jgi:EAL domain-containing protein (putative c-di-GMP-specific phosphodiesterase class I)